MRVLCALFLLAFLAAIGIFAYQNQQELSLRFIQWSATASIPIVVGAAYLLGMFSGWTVIGMLRRSLDRVVEPDRRAETSRSF